MISSVSCTDLRLSQSLRRAATTNEPWRASIRSKLSITVRTKSDRQPNNNNSLTNLGVPLHSNLNVVDACFQNVVGLCNWIYGPLSDEKQTSIEANFAQYLKKCI